MSDAKTLSERIDALETRLTFQDETVETLNKTITEQWRKIDALARQVAHLNERLVEAETRTPGAANEPPPHYLSVATLSASPNALRCTVRALRSKSRPKPISWPSR